MAILEGTDFRLLEAFLELDALKDHLEIIEKQIEQGKTTEREKAEAYIKKEGVDWEDPEWQWTWQEYEEQIKSQQKLFRGSFLVMLYAVFESTTTEIACKIQCKQSVEKSISDLRGDFPKKAGIYFEHLGFELYTNGTIREKIKMLSVLRNAYAHTSGRIEMLNKKPQKAIKAWVQERRGISEYFDSIVCEADLVADISRTVDDFLRNLIERYKRWDDQYGNK